MKSVLLSRVSILLAAIVIIGVGCRKLDYSSSGTSVTVTNPDGEVPVEAAAGKGGDAKLRIIPMHDGLEIDSCQLFIKYNSAVVPFKQDYDDSVWAMQVDDQAIATFEGLKPGNYYLFAEGWDLVRSLRIEGGMPFIIDEKNKGTTFTFALQTQELIK